MGLDNGLRIKAKTTKGEKLLTKNFKHLKEDYILPEIELDYWRKCWNMRRRAIEILDYDSNEQIAEMSLVDLYRYVEKVLKYFLKEKHWKYYDDSIWEWHIMLPSIAEAICNIRNFLKLVEDEELTDEDFEIYWYDSY